MRMFQGYLTPWDNPNHYPELYTKRNRRARARAAELERPKPDIPLGDFKTDPRGGPDDPDQAPTPRR